MAEACCKSSVRQDLELLSIQSRLQLNPACSSCSAQAMTVSTANVDALSSHRGALSRAHSCERHPSPGQTDASTGPCMSSISAGRSSYENFIHALSCRDRCRSPPVKRTLGGFTICGHNLQHARKSFRKEAYQCTQFKHVCSSAGLAHISKMMTQQVQMSNDPDFLLPVCHELAMMTLIAASTAHPYIGMINNAVKWLHVVVSERLSML